MTDKPWTATLSSTPEGVCLRIKVSPGARRAGIVGVLGDCLKVAVSSPAQDGRANRDLCALLADILGVRAADVLIVAGQSSRRKTVLARGLTPCAAAEKLAALLDHPA